MRGPSRCLCVAIFFVVFWAAGAVGAGEKSYRIDVVPDLETDLGIFEPFRGVDLNNRGAVVGWALGADSLGDVREALFFYRNGRVRQLDSGPVGARAVAVNNKGMVLARTAELRSRLLKVSRGRSGVRLEAGLEAAQLRRIAVRDFGPNGEVLASVGPPGAERAYIFRSRGAEWEPVDPGAAGFDAAQTIPEAINRRGDILMRATDAEYRNGSVFILRADGGIEPVLDPALGNFIAGGFDDSRVVTGSSYDGRFFQAFYYTPVDGGRSIHPEGFRESFAIWLNRDGATLVAASQGRSRSPFSYFYYHPSEGLTPLWTRDELRALAVRAGCRKPREARTGGIWMNEEREILARLICVGAGGSFHFTPETGFTLMRDVFVAAGFESRVAHPVDFNDRGQILIHYFDDSRERTAVALLSPLD